MDKLNQRQLNIYSFIGNKEGATNREIRNFLKSINVNVSRMTVIRDLDKLLQNNLITKNGHNRNVVYRIIPENAMLIFIDPEKYFNKNIEDRILISKTFNFKIFDKIKFIKFPQNEINELEKLNNEKYREKIKNISDTVLKKETERLLIDFSWKSSQIEGNTYSILETETLLKEKIEAKGHSKEEAMMILGHKKALDYILQNKKEFQNITVAKIENIHSLLIDSLNIKRNIRQRPVGIGGTKYKPLDNEYQIREALEKTSNFISDKKIHPIVRAMMSVLLISYIQPFEDGNKRTARLLGNAILLAHNYCPLSYRTVDVTEYKKAILLFYEQNNIFYFKQIFIEQFKFALEEYFL